MSTITLNSINPFTGWSQPACLTTPQTEHGEIDDGLRREYLSQLLSADHTGCSSEAGASALMAMFPRDF
jgi:hypothetical protein